MIAATAGRPDLGRLARDRLRAEPPAVLDPQAQPNGDHALEPGGWGHGPAASPRPAAVLVPIVLRDEPTVLLTERASNLRDHSGQIAFPGGKVDEGDGSPLETAFREAEEEIGLDRAHASPLGYLDAYLSSSNYFVIPAVALVQPGLRLRPNPVEVADVFEVPLAFLMDETNHELHAREWKGRIRQYYAIPYRDRYIWGVTAGIIRNMYERLHGA